MTDKTIANTTGPAGPAIHYPNGGEPTLDTEPKTGTEYPNADVSAVLPSYWENYIPGSLTSVWYRPVDMNYKTGGREYARYPDGSVRLIEGWLTVWTVGLNGTTQRRELAMVRPDPGSRTLTPATQAFTDEDTMRKVSPVEIVAVTPADQIRVVPASEVENARRSTDAEQANMLRQKIANLEREAERYEQRAAGTRTDEVDLRAAFTATSG